MAFDRAAAGGSRCRSAWREGGKILLRIVEILEITRLRIHVMRGARAFGVKNRHGIFFDLNRLLYPISKMNGFFELPTRRLIPS